MNLSLPQTMLILIREIGFSPQKKSGRLPGSGLPDKM